MTNVLLVVDMLNDFCKPGGAFYDENLEAIIPAVKNLVKKRLEQNWKIIIIEDAHIEEDPEIKLLGKHAMAGEWGSEIVDELSFLENDSDTAIIVKGVFDAFLGVVAEGQGSDLEEILGNLKPNIVEIAGVATDICVFHTVSTLVGLKNAGRLNRNLEIVVYEDCVATFDDNEYEGYTAEEKTKFVFFHLKKWFGVKIANSAKIPQTRKKEKKCPLTVHFLKKHKKSPGFKIRIFDFFKGKW